MRVLIGCEESQTVCKAFRALGHEAYSCDLVECSGGHPEWHLKMDVLKAIGLREWDLGIFHPPCDDLAGCGARWFPEKVKNGSQGKSIQFFLRIADCGLPRWCIENPVGIMSKIFRKPDQYIQPWQFGHGETKKTCLWLHNLPKLIPTDVVEGREQRIWKMAPSADRARLRSITYGGIAKAMADQWSL